MAKVHNDPRAKKLIMLIIAEQRAEGLTQEEGVRGLKVGDSTIVEGWEGESEDCPGEGEFAVSVGKSEYDLKVFLTSTDDSWTADIDIARTK